MKKLALLLLLASCSKAAAPAPEVSADVSEVAADAPASPAEDVSPADAPSPVTP